MTGKENTVTAGLWKMLERISSVGIQFVIQVVLARILSPEDYGILAIMLGFVAIAQVFTQSGLNTSLIQNKDIELSDYSTIFYTETIIVSILYTILFVCAKPIEQYFGYTDFVIPFRVIALVLFPSALTSVQTAYEIRQLRFKYIFVSTLVSVLLSGIIGIVLAKLGAGIWALVIQTLTQQCTFCLVMLCTCEWRVMRHFDTMHFRKMISYGWKLLVGSLIDSAYVEIRSFIIGKRFSADALGVYVKGQQFPQVISNCFVGTIQGVMLPAIASKQENRSGVLVSLRKSIVFTAFIITPVMLGMISIGETLIKVVLTEKWSACIPFLKGGCVIYLFYAIHAVHTQTLNAIGRSDITLTVQTVKRSVSVVLILASAIIFSEPIVTVYVMILVEVIGYIADAVISKKVFQYTLKEQFVDVMPYSTISLVMSLTLSLFKTTVLGQVALLVIRIALGVAIYLMANFVIKTKGYELARGVIKGIIQRK